jgi:hypothetical protein
MRVVVYPIPLFEAFHPVASVHTTIRIPICTLAGSESILKVAVIDFKILRGLASRILYFKRVQQIRIIRLHARFEFGVAQAYPNHVYNPP